MYGVSYDTHRKQISKWCWGECGHGVIGVISINNLMMIPCREEVCPHLDKQMADPVADYDGEPIYLRKLVEPSPPESPIKTTKIHLHDGRILDLQLDGGFMKWFLVTGGPGESESLHWWSNGHVLAALAEPPEEDARSTRIEEWRKIEAQIKDPVFLAVKTGETKRLPNGQSAYELRSSQCFCWINEMYLPLIYCPDQGIFPCISGERSPIIGKRDNEMIAVAMPTL